MTDDEPTADQVAARRFPLGLVLGIAGAVGAVVLLIGGGLLALWVFVLAPKPGEQIAAVDEQVETGVVDPQTAGNKDQAVAEKKDEPVKSDLADSGFGETDEKKADENGESVDDSTKEAGKDATAPVGPDGENKTDTKPEVEIDPVMVQIASDPTRLPRMPQGTMAAK